MAERGRAFSAQFSGEPATPAATAISATGAPADDSRVRTELGTAVDRALDRFPGTISPETRERIRTAVLDTAAATASRLGVGLSDISKVELGFNLNGSVFTGSLAGTVYPPGQAGEWSVALGASTPNLPGASISMAIGFNTGTPLLGTGTALNGRVTVGLPGLGDISIKAGTDGGVTFERDIPGLSVGGGLPNAGIELNVPIADMVSLAERAAGVDPTSLMQQATRITTEAHTQSEARYRELQRGINAEYDARIRAAATPELRDILDRERNARLFDLQRQQVENYDMIERMYAEMLTRIESRRRQ